MAPNIQNRLTMMPVRDSSVGPEIAQRSRVESEMLESIRKFRRFVARGGMKRLAT